MAVDLFKQDFKYYKARCPPPDLSNVINFSSIDNNNNDVRLIDLNKGANVKPQLLSFFGLRPLEEWRAFSFTKKDGLIFIKNPFYNAGHRYWVARCLKDYPKKPHKLNLDVHGDLDDSEDWWEACHTGNEKQDEILRKKLRWSTLGYHHDWETKLYTEDSRHPFPADLRDMCRLVAPICGFQDFIPQASIVNYYHMDSTLAPHTDHSEKNLEAPLLSLSFGQSAIFLIGGETKETKPTAMFLNSGDIVIMSKASRLCYHAVPKILEGTDRPWEGDMENFMALNENIPDSEALSIFENVRSDEFWKPFGNYLVDSRVNINVRQVLYKNQCSLDDNR